MTNTNGSGSCVTEDEYLSALYERIAAYCISKGYAAPPRGIVDKTKMHVVSFNPETGFANGNFYEFLGLRASMPLKEKDLENPNWVEEMLAKSFPFPLLVNGNSINSFGAVIVPVEKNTGKLLLLKEWRLPIGSFDLNFPRGFPEKAEKGIVNGIRELAEETGYEAKLGELVSIGHLWENTGYSYNSPEVFYVTFDATDFKCEEGNSAVLLSKEEFKKKVKEEVIKDNFTLAAFTKFDAKIA